MGEILLNAVLVVIIVAIVGSAIAYIIRAKKNGARCVGCSAAGCSCNAKNKKNDVSQCGCGCGGEK